MSPSKHRAPPVLIAPKPRNSNSEWHPNLTQRTKGGKSLLPSSMRWKAPICPSSRWRPKPFSCLRWTLPLCRAFLRSTKPPMPTALWPDRHRRQCRSRTRYTSRAGANWPRELRAWVRVLWPRLLLDMVDDSAAASVAHASWESWVGNAGGHGLTGWGGCTGEGSGRCGTVLRKRSGPVH